MIDEHFEPLRVATSTKQACGLLGQPRATHYRRKQPPVLGPPAPRSMPTNALTEAERQQVLTALRSPEYCDLAAAQVWAKLLDDDPEHDRYNGNHRGRVRCHARHHHTPPHRPMDTRVMGTGLDGIPSRASLDHRVTEQLLVALHHRRWFTTQPPPRTDRPHRVTRRDHSSRVTYIHPQRHRG